MRHRIVIKILVLSFSCVIFNSLAAIHNASRYFPFLERPDNYLYQGNSYVHAAPFYTSASTAVRRGGGKAGIPELWGNYDLHDVIASLLTVNPTIQNPIFTETGSTEFENKSIKFKAAGKVRSVGCILNYEQDLVWNRLMFGAWMPLMYVSSANRYEFNQNDFISQLTRTLNPQELVNLNDLMDRIRRDTHEQIGFLENRSERGGIGDLDVHVRWNYFLDHKLLMRSINIDVQVGCIAPTGMILDTNNPSSVPFMQDGHWGLYFDIVPEFELKQDLKIGFMLGALFQFKNQREMRIPVFSEPAIFSSLVGKVEVDPAATLKLSTYVILENLTDGLHLQGRYSYLRHGNDGWKDVRSDKTIPSYLTITPAQVTAFTTDIQSTITQDTIASNIAQKSRLTSWRSHYISLQLLYDTKQALHNWVMDPNFYITYDGPIGGNGISNTHQVTFGVELHF